MTAPRAQRRWMTSRLLLIGAFVVSVLVHVVSVSSDLIYAWWANSKLPEQNEKLRKLTHKLAAQDWDDDAKRPDALKGIHRPDLQTVWMQPRQPLVAAALATPTPEPTVTPTPRPKRKQASKPVRVTPQPETMLAASTIAALTPTPEPLFASAPASAVASAVAMSAPVASAPAAAEITLAAVPGQGPLAHKGFPRKASITYVERSFAIPAKLTWEASNGHYKLDLTAHAPFLTASLTSEGRIDRDGLVPEHYKDSRQGKTRNEAFFDWANKVVTFHDGDKPPTTGPLTPGAQDLLSAAFQFAQQGARMKSFTLSLNSGAKQYKDVAFEIRGETTLRIAGQAVDAILVHGAYEDRASDFWLAPQWSNLPVRMLITLGNKSYDVIANEISVDGQTIVEPPTPGIQRPHPPGEVLNN